MSRGTVRLISDLLSELNDFLIRYHAINDGPFQTTWRVAFGLLMTFGLMLLIWEMFVP